MKSPGLAVVVCVGILSALFAGCENPVDPMKKHEKNWVAPSNIAGTWFHAQVSGNIAGDGYVIAQNGSKVSITSFFRHTDGHVLSILTYSATYDQATGLLEYHGKSADTENLRFCFRFTSDTEMWTVESVSSDIGFKSYTRE